jgi:hypothetical protein
MMIDDGREYWDWALKEEEEEGGGWRLCLMAFSSNT